MNKTLKRIMTIALALILCLSLAAPALAADETPNPNGNGLKGVVVYVNMIVDKDLAQYPQATATITVSAGAKADYPTSEGDTSAIVGRDAVMEGLKVGGNSNGTATVSFDGTAPLEGGSDKVADATQKYASHGVKIDFSGITFPNPGVYRYDVKQTSLTVASGKAGFTEATETYQILVFVVVNEESGEPEIGGTIVKPGEDNEDQKKPESPDPNPTDPDPKDPTDPEQDGYLGGTKGYMNFNNYYGAESITIEKSVTGNQGDRNEVFSITVDLAGSPDGIYYITNVNPTGTEGEYTHSNKTMGITVKDGTGSGTISLKHGESVVISAAKGTKYVITETGATNYVTVITEGKESAKSSSDFTEATQNNKTTGEAKTLSADVYYIINNNNQDTIPGTGVLLTIAPFVILMIVGVVGVTIVMKKKKYE